LDLKLAKRANISKTYFCFKKLDVGIIKREKTMLSLNPLKKVQETKPQKSYGRKTFAHSKKLPFFCHFVADNVSHVFFATFSVDLKSASDSAFSNTHIAFLNFFFTY
jgi:hypothetical protein